jgi:DNA (cytosine-5)-methyltransferase 1
MNSQNNFTVISTFSGCGGSSLGYKLADGKVLLAVEMDNNAVQTYKLNFPETKIYHGDIHNLTVEKVFELTGIKEGELDILDGSPPCQGFSTAGKREFCDPRNQLYNEYIRLLRGLKPKIFIMENVSGLVKSKMKLIFKDILTELKSSGYKVKVRLMNAKYYNVPQSRQRLIFIGVRNDLKIDPTHPKPQSKPITVKKALTNVKNDEKERAWLLDIKNSSIYPTLLRMKPGESYAKYKKQGFNFIKLDPNKPAPTLTRTMWSKASTNGQIHPYELRKLTINEAKRLASYPDEFKFTGKYEDQWARIGNSVPPNFMKAIAEHVKNGILEKIV